VRGILETSQPFRCCSPQRETKRQTFVIEEALRWLPDVDNQQEDIAEDMSVTGRPQAGSAERAYLLVADDNADMRSYLRQSAPRNGPAYR
jgi:hypothetical protein